MSKEIVCQSMPNKIPTKLERQKRRETVYKLHFEEGYSARKIAQILEVNRNTVNEDISYLYSQVRYDSNQIMPSDWVNKQLLRFETQQSRLIAHLHAAATMSERIQIERLLTELGSKLMSFMRKLNDSRITNVNSHALYLNKWMKENNYEHRFITLSELMSIPNECRDMVFNTIKKYSQYQI